MPQRLRRPWPSLKVSVSSTASTAESIPEELLPCYFLCFLINGISARNAEPVVSISFPWANLLSALGERGGGRRRGEDL